MIGRRRSLLVLFAVLAALLAAVPAGAASDGSPLGVTLPTRITVGDDTPTRTYSSPAIAIDPENEDTVLAAYSEMRTSRCSLARSLDGGRTWKRLDATPALPSYPFCFTPASTNVHQAHLAFGSDHTVYLAMPGWDVQDARNFSVLLARSTDLGDTWSTTIVRDARGRTPVETNRPVSSLAVDTRGPTDIVYVSFAHFRPPVTGAPATPSLPYVAVSTDGGKTFGEPVNAARDAFTTEAGLQAALEDRPSKVPPFITTPVTPQEQITADKFGGCCPRVVLDSKGTIYTLYLLTAAGVVPGPLPSLFLSRSTDQGRTFTASRVVRPSATLSNPSFRWSPHGGPDGTLHLVYENKVPASQGDRDIYYQRSTDGGRTWSEPRMLNDDDPKLLRAQFMPNMSIAPDGRVDVAWWDFRDDTGAFFNDVYLISSPDNGATWSKNIRVTDRSIDRKIGPWSNGFDVRQPVGLAATSRYTIAGWDDTRNGDRDGELQDLYSAFVQFEALPAGTSKGLIYVLAGVLGLVLAGVVLSGVGIVNRRRARPPKSPAQPAPEPAGVG